MCYKSRMMCLTIAKSGASRVLMTIRSPIAYEPHWKRHLYQWIISLYNTIIPLRQR